MHKLNSDTGQRENLQSPWRIPTWRGDFSESTRKIPKTQEVKFLGRGQGEFLESTGKCLEIRGEFLEGTFPFPGNWGEIPGQHRESS